MADLEQVEATVGDETGPADTVTAETVPDPAGEQSDGNAGISAGDTFPRDYVESLRKESAGYRDRAKTAEQRITELEKRLHHAMVTDRGLLVSPDELPYDPANLDPETMDKAIDELLTAKPYLRARPIAGDIGQGQRGGSGKPEVNLLALMRGGR